MEDRITLRVNKLFHVSLELLSVELQLGFHNCMKKDGAGLAVWLFSFLTSFITSLTLLIISCCFLAPLLFSLWTTISSFGSPNFAFLLLPLPAVPPLISSCGPQWLQGEVVELCARLDPMSSSSGPGHQGSSHQPPMIACPLHTDPPFLWYSISQSSFSPSFLYFPSFEFSSSLYLKSVWFLFSFRFCPAFHLINLTLFLLMSENSSLSGF